LDLRSYDYDGWQLAKAYKKLVKLDKIPNGGLGIYPGFIHIDLGKPRQWYGK